MATFDAIAAVGAGRMGRGIAVAFAYSGHPVRLIDAKPRDAADAARLADEARAEIRATLTMMAGFGLLERAEIDGMLSRVTHFSHDALAEGLAGARFIFEGVPETMEVKAEAFARISAHADPSAIIASTTSTILSNDLQPLVTHPGRFLNAHWLNPAFLVPLVELSPGTATAPKATQALKDLLERIGKVPVICAPSPGYIVPRIQVLAMNEAARMVEDGVATAEDIDTATRYGFGFRFAVLGLLEFIDWGGGDILYYASRYMADATGEDRFAAPRIIGENMEQRRTGLRDGQGFLDYDGMDIAAYQQGRLDAFAAMLRHLGKMPVKG
ncbi:3-hydroxybutyryl-CoA dehydrogenase [Aestuariivita sp.]|jgi:3-hydroxybutyryl-CoA dehydrogenase|uniref:3-hydroxybutyryl-CoA dehydrogenase n=1 Tax=Aestuariivita sp. TaxID=1872407 RepID=UPI0021728133|nr:3-hydroxybutyryl-CoA dehydrogenase [Aestuariivita sp.]MCE8008217.1 3-hydroxybutyryl-CoA dehydrogenase [Aestuariivita sp.]